MHLARCMPFPDENCPFSPPELVTLMRCLIAQASENIIEKWHGKKNSRCYAPEFAADRRLKPQSPLYVYKPEDAECEYFYAYLVHLGAVKVRRNDIFGGVWKPIGKTRQILDDENQICGFKTKFTYKNDALEHHYMMEVWSLHEEGVPTKKRNDTTLVFCHLLRDGIPWKFSTHETSRSRVDNPVEEGVELVLIGEEQRIKDAGVLAAAAAAAAAETEAKFSGAGAGLEVQISSYIGV